MWLKFASRANLKGAVGLEGFKVAIWQLAGEGSGGSILPASVFLHYSMMKHRFLTPVLSVSFSLTCMLLVCVDSPNANDPGGSYINRYPKGKLWFPNKYKFWKALLADHCCKVTMSPNSLQIGGSLHRCLWKRRLGISVFLPCVLHVKLSRNNREGYAFRGLAFPVLENGWGRIVQTKHWCSQSVQRYQIFFQTSSSWAMPPPLNPAYGVCVCERERGRM